MRRDDSAILLDIAHAAVAVLHQILVPGEAAKRLSLALTEDLEGLL